jgi:hypothetical protein
MPRDKIGKNPIVVARRRENALEGYLQEATD